MARRRKSQESRDWLFPHVTVADEAEQQSLLDVLDNVLNRGAVLTGDVILGVANVDLIYVKLSVLLAAFDKVTKNSAIRPVSARPRRKVPRRLASQKPRRATKNRR